MSAAPPPPRLRRWQAHSLFVEAGLVSFYDPMLPTIEVGQQTQGSAAFMDIMKLRLLYLAEV